MNGTEARMLPFTSDKKKKDTNSYKIVQNFSAAPAKRRGEAIQYLLGKLYINK
jgi:hypothetical protein